MDYRFVIYRARRGKLGFMTKSYVDAPCINDRVRVWKTREGAEKFLKRFYGLKDMYKILFVMPYWK